MEQSINVYRLVKYDIDASIFRDRLTCQSACMLAVTDDLQDKLKLIALQRRDTVTLIKPTVNEQNK